MKKWALLVLALGAAGGIFLWGNRCREQPLPHGHKARICHRLFRSPIMLVFDRDGRLFEYSVMEKLPRGGFQPRESYVDLFDSGHISEFVTNRVGGEPGLQKVEIATADDGRVDLVMEFSDVAHPLGGHLRRAISVDKPRCMEWAISKKQVSGRWMTKSTCADPKAFVPIAPNRVLEIVESLPILREREGLILGRIRQGQAVLGAEGLAVVQGPSFP